MGVLVFVFTIGKLGKDSSGNVDKKVEITYLHVVLLLFSIVSGGLSFRNYQR